MLADLLIVGEAPSTDEPGKPLDEGSSGRRMHSMLGGSPHDYAAVVNLLPTPVKRWTPIVARALARSLLLRRPETRLILCGRRVAWAFEVGGAPWMTWVAPKVPTRDRLLAVFPHPSGRSRWWNDPEQTERAAAFLRQTVGI